ncbi:MAG: hypothetical protein ACFFDN_13460 [Candidatus Hodarchaeota archaeon]
MPEWKGIDLARLSVVIIFILTPIYFFLLMGIINQDPLNPFTFYIVRYYFGKDVETFIRTILVPLLFIIPWWLFILAYKNKFANSFSEIKQTTSVIPIRWMIFYGFNGIFTIITFIIPYISPFFVIIAFASFAWAIIRNSEFAWNRTKAFLVFYSFIIFGLFLALPILVLFEFVTKYVIVFNQIMIIWNDFLPIFYEFSVIIANALAIGSLFWMIYAGAAEFEKESFSGMAMTEVPETGIKVLELILFAAFFTIWIYSLPPEGTTLKLIMTYINWTCLIIGTLVMFICFFKGLGRGDDKRPFFGYFVMILFLGLEAFRMYPTLIGGLKTTPIELMSIIMLATGIIFLIVFLVAFIRASDEDID